MREVNRRYLILCQGETEYYYCKSLKESLPRKIQLLTYESYYREDRFVK